MLSVRVLITGSSGQLGRALLESLPDGVQATGMDRKQCDLADPAQTRAVVLAHRPDILINAAAYTQVDAAESEPDSAFKVNADGPRTLAEAVAEIDGRLIQISTDFVFDGSQSRPYLPDAPTHPLNAYGASKLAGEKAVLGRPEAMAVVIRTAWVYARHGNNFVRTMLRLMSTRDSVSVVSDQIGTPTWAGSIAKAVWAAASKPAISGMLHWTDAGVASWYEFAIAIQEEALVRGLLAKRIPIKPISAADYARQSPTAAARPRFSVLDLESTKHVLGIEPPHWRTNLGVMLDEFAAGPMPGRFE
jgi:dTDP-4-dehydrorhamnose reductase